MSSLVNLIVAPWPWYISGPLLGLSVPLLLLVGNKQLGISSSFCHFHAAIGLKKIELFNYNWKDHIWNLLFILGAFLAGTIAVFVLNVDFAQLSDSANNYFFEKKIPTEGVFPTNYFEQHIFSLTTLLLVFGGLLIGFGSRYANGCTAGHAIMGLSLLSPGSLVAVIGFFVGGLAGTWLILDQLL